MYKYEQYYKQMHIPAAELFSLQWDETVLESSASALCLHSVELFSKRKLQKQLVDTLVRVQDDGLGLIVTTNGISLTNGNL